MQDLRSTFAQNQGNILWILVALAVTAKVAIKGGERSVYPIFANAAHNWGAGIDMYIRDGELDAYVYSPTFAIFFYPFSLNAFWGHVTWILSSMAVLYYACTQMHQHMLRHELHNEASGNADTSLNLFLLLIAIGFVRSVWQGQSNILLIALILLGVVALVRNREWLGSFFLVSAVFIKIWPIALIMLLSFFRVGLAPKCLAFAFALAAFPFLLLPWDAVEFQYLSWFNSLQVHHRYASIRDFWTIWEMLPFGKPDITIYRITQLICGFGTFLLTIYMLQQSRSHREQLFLTLSLWVCWQLQIGPGSERMTYSIFAPVIAYALVVYNGPKNRQPLLVASFVLLAIFTHGSLERLFSSLLPIAETMIILSVTSYFAWLLIHIIRFKKANTTSIEHSL